jgi:hypothetical protein
MKTTQLIALVCSFVSCATLRTEATGADFAPDAVALDGRTKFTTEVGGQLVAESVRDAGSQKDGANKGDTLIEFSLLASAVGMVVLLSALLRAPEGYEDGDGFHLSMQRERTSPVRHVRRSLAHI